MTNGYITFILGVSGFPTHGSRILIQTKGPFILGCAFVSSIVQKTLFIIKHNDQPVYIHVQRKLLSWPNLFFTSRFFAWEWRGAVPNQTQFCKARTADEEWASERCANTHRAKDKIECADDKSNAENSAACITRKITLYSSMLAVVLATRNCRLINAQTCAEHPIPPWLGKFLAEDPGRLW